MKSFNRVIIMGHVGDAPALRFFPDGGAVANFSVATNQSWTDKKSGEKKEHTEWHRVVVHNKAAEAVDKYLDKGCKVFVEGYLKTREFEDKTGTKRYLTEVHAINVNFITFKPAASGQQPVAAQAPVAGVSAGQATSDGFDDEIPF